MSPEGAPSGIERRGRREQTPLLGSSATAARAGAAWRVGQTSKEPHGVRRALDSKSSTIGVEIAPTVNNFSFPIK